MKSIWDLNTLKIMNRSKFNFKVAIYGEYYIYKKDKYNRYSIHYMGEDKIWKEI